MNSGAALTLTLAVTTNAPLADEIIITNQVLLSGGGHAYQLPVEDTKITIFNAVQAGFELNPEAGTAPLTVILTNTGQHATEFLWLFGDGQSSTTSALTHTHHYTSPGEFIITQVVSNPLSNDLFSRTLPITLNPIVKRGPYIAASSSMVTYTLMITNLESVALTNLIITDVLPMNANYVSGGSLVNGNAVRWMIPSLASGNAMTVSFVVTATETITNDTYHLRADNDFYAVGKHSVVTQIDTPIMGLIANNDGPTALNRPTIFSATVAAGNNISYQWSFGDGETGLGAMVTHTYAAPGVYTTIVTATNSSSLLTATTEVEVFLRPEVLHLLPPANSHLAPITTTLTITYNEPIGPNTVNAQTFTANAMQTGIITGNYSVVGNVVSFTPAKPFRAGEPIQVTLTDDILNFNGDGAISPTIWQFWSWVSGGFGTFVSYGTTLPNQRSLGVALGDLDGDGDLDAFNANGWGSSAHVGKPNEVWFNDGLGQFSDSGQRLADEDSRGVGLVDLDGDNDLDAFVTNGDLFGGAPNTVWWNDGSGYFTDSGQRLGNRNSWDVAMGDLDGDGHIDAYVANRFGPQEVWINDGFGYFSGWTVNGSSDNAYGVAIGDLDGDGDLDSVTTHGGFHSNEVFFNDGSGHFFSSGQTFEGGFSYDVALGDLDLDGDLDAFMSQKSDLVWRIWMNDGNGTFSHTSQVFHNNNLSVKLGDLDGDTDLDVFLGTGGAEQVWLNDGFGYFTQNQILGSSDSTWSVALGDLDGDGDLDAYAGNGIYGGVPNQVWLNESILPTPTSTPVVSPTPEPTITTTPTNMPSPTYSATPTPSSTSTNTPAPTNSATPPPVPSATPTPSFTSTPTNTSAPTPSATALPSSTPTPGMTATTLATPTPLPSETPVSSPTALPTATSSPLPTAASTPLITPTPTLVPDTHWLYLPLMMK